MVAPSKYLRDSRVLSITNALNDGVGHRPRAAGVFAPFSVGQSERSRSKRNTRRDFEVWVCTRLDEALEYRRVFAGLRKHMKQKGTTSAIEYLQCIGGIVELAPRELTPCKFKIESGL